MKTLEEVKKEIDFVELTKFVLKYALNRKTFNAIYFQVNENYNIYGCSKVDVRSKNTNAYLYLLYCGKPNGNVGEKVVILYKFNSNDKKELFSINYESLSIIMNENV
jgi:hypothetical protein